MSEIIEDGTGKGYLAKVDSDNRLVVKAIREPISFHVNETEERYFTLTINKQATNIGDCIGYVKNSDSDNLNIESIYLFSTAATLLTVKIKDAGTPTGGTDIVPANCNAGSNLVADGTFQEGVAIGGLTGGVTTLNWYAGASDGKLLDFFPCIILPTNAVATFYVNQNTASVIVGLGMWYHGVL